MLAVLYITPVKNSAERDLTFHTVTNTKILQPATVSQSNAENFTLSLPLPSKNAPISSTTKSQAKNDLQRDPFFLTSMGNPQNVISARKMNRTWLNQEYDSELDFPGRERRYILPDYFTWNHNITKEISLLIKTEKANRQTVMSSTGFSLVETNFTTSILTLTQTTYKGDALLQNVNTTPNPLVWEVAVNPIKNLQFTTAMVDNHIQKDNKFDINTARVGMSIDLDSITVSLKYAYSDNTKYNSNELRQIYLNLLGNEKGIQDSTSLGFTIFLDNQKKYSVYIGNQFYNTLFYQPGLSNRTLLPSMTASFKGKASERVKYFFNFQNQPYKEYSYFNYGLFRFPIISQSTIDFATALGMEQSF